MVRKKVLFSTIQSFVLLIFTGLFISSCSWGGGMPAASLTPTTQYSLHGTLVSQLSCTAEMASDIVVAVANPTEVLICQNPLENGLINTAKLQSVSVTQKDTGFDKLVQTLSIPDQETPDGQMCPMLLQITPNVYGKNANGTFLVSQPKIQCMMPNPLVQDLLKKYLNGGTVTNEPLPSNS